MIQSNMKRPRRDDLVKSILDDLESVITDSLFFADSVPGSVQSEIRSALIAETTRLLDSCSLEELQSSTAIRNWLDSVRGEIAVHLRPFASEDQDDRLF